MKNPWIIPAAALLVGAAGGFISGKVSSPSEGKATATEESSQRTRASSRSGLSSDDEAAKRTGQRVQSALEAMNTPGHSARVKALIDYYSGLSPEQLAEEAKKLENLPMAERMMSSFLLFGRWAEVDPMAAMSHASTMGMAGGFVRPTILQSWASVDPENAAKYYSENPREFAMMGGFGGRGGQGGASLIAAEWAKQDPQGALDWASSLKGEDKSNAMTSVVREVAMTDPKKAAELAGSIDPADRGDAYRSIAQRWGASNFSEAEAWVRSLPTDQQGAAMASAIAGLSQDNPQLASTKVNAMTAGEDKDRAVRNLVENWSKTNPKEAAAYLLTQENAADQGGAIRDVVSNWTHQDNAGALTFINAQPAGELRDTAINAYVMSDRSSEPSALMSVAETIQDEGDRSRTMGMAAMRWMREDEAAAKEYIQASNSIPANMKERLLSNNRGFGGPGGPDGRRGNR